MKNRRTVDLEAIAWHAMEKYGFEPGFPEAVETEVATISGEKPQGESDGTRDLRGLLWSSIDNEDSMDLDQIE
ncbi:MAG: RNB domain-containing ribonuclease, partial [Methanomicrobiales archaeon]